MSGEKPDPPVKLDDLNPGVSDKTAEINKQIKAQPAPSAFSEEGLTEVARVPYWLMALATGCDAWELSDNQARRIGVVLAPLADKYLNEWAATHQAEIVAAIAIAGVTANRARDVKAWKEEKKSKLKSKAEPIEIPGGNMQAARDAEIMAGLDKKK